MNDETKVTQSFDLSKLMQKPAETSKLKVVVKPAEKRTAAFDSESTMRNLAHASAVTAAVAKTKSTKFFVYNHLLDIKHTALRYFLAYHERTEVPPLMLAWSVISAVGALLGRNAYYSLGEHKIYANQYICFVGSPGARKSTGISYAKALAKLGNPGIRFAPTDTGGRRQGLIAAFLPRSKKTNRQDNLAANLEKLNALGLLANPAAIMPTPQEEAMQSLPPASLSDLYACASELGSLTGINQIETFVFFSELWDMPDVYEYRLRTDEITISKPTFNILAGVTPETLRTIMPVGAIGQGVMSRFMFVYGSPEKKVPRPIAWNDEFEHYMSSVMLMVRKVEGEFHEDIDAANALDRIYEHYTPIISDVRLLGYLERRHVHLVKLAICLAAMRGENVISVDDVYDANYLLEATEFYMADAIGQVGDNRVAICSSLLRYALASATYGMSEDELRRSVKNDYSHEEITRAILTLQENDVIFSQEIQQINGLKRVQYFLDLSRGNIRPRDVMVRAINNVK